jgi:HEAT repeat protein
MRRGTLAVALAALVLPGLALAQPLPQPVASGAAAMAPAKAIDTLGDLDYDTRTTAARIIRRASPAQAVPALLQAVASHGDSYVRFRALVLLTGFNDPRTEATMVDALASPNDRLREVAYGYFADHPSVALAPRFLRALASEESEFVRPALVRSLAALAGSDPSVAGTLIREAGRGLDYFRSSVIEALGEFRVSTGLEPLTAIARQEGPLQDDAALAIGKIGGAAAVTTLASLQKTAPAEVQPSVAAAICLAGRNCESHVGYLRKVLRYAEDAPGYQELLRAAASGLGALASRGNQDSLELLFETGIPSEDPVRAPVALAVAQAALRDPDLLLRVLVGHADRQGATLLLAEGFDMLEEDYDEERFYAAVRRAYWAAPDGSPMRALCEQVIMRLDF